LVRRRLLVSVVEHSCGGELVGLVHAFEEQEGTRLIAPVGVGRVDVPSLLGLSALPILPEPRQIARTNASLGGSSWCTNARTLSGFLVLLLITHIVHHLLCISLNCRKNLP
jgi:hypothetical protein